MNISGLFIRRPIATTLAMGAVLLAGVVGYQQLPISDLPTVEYPTISVTAGLAGASPETMASTVATPLENQFSSIPGVTQITSTSGQGGTSVTLQFSLNRSIDAAAQDVASAISRVQRSLPRDMLPPSYNKSNPADQPIISIALSSATLPLSTVNEYAQTLIAQRLSTIDGVGQVSVTGGKKYAVRIQLDPRALAYRRIGLDQVITAITSNNVNLPTGVLWGEHRALALQADGQLRNAAAFRAVVVTYRNGAPVLLQDLGRVLDDVQDSRAGSWLNGVPAVTLTVQRQPGTNTVNVADAVRAAVDRIQADLPPSIELHYLYDRSSTIRASVSDVRFTFLLTLSLVVLVIFLFLRNIPATIIPSMALPMSIIGTFGVMALLGYSVDNLSMMALTLAVGFVVDDAIVMLENIVRHVEMGKPPFQAALDGAREVGFTIVSMTLSLVAVFIPVLFMQGILGRLFREFAVTISVAILVSGFVSLTLTPMMCSRFLRAHGTGMRRGRFLDAVEGLYQGALDFYRRSLEWVMARRRATMVFSGGVLLGTLGLFALIPKGFIPQEDIGQVNGSIEQVEGASFDEVLAHLRRAQQAILARHDPDIAALSTSTGGGGIGHGANHFHANIYLRPRGQRSRTAQDVIRDLRPALNLPGDKVSLSMPATISVGGRGSSSTYQFTLQSPDLASLYAYGAIMEERMQSLPGLTDISSDIEIKSPKLAVTVDRPRAAALGVNIEQVEQALGNAYGTRQVSTIYGANDQYPVLLELEPEFQRDQVALGLLTITSRNGTLVPLSSVASLAPGVGPFVVNHTGQLPSVTLSFNLRPGVALGTAVDGVQRLAREVLPANFTTNFSGTAQVFQQSQRGLLFLLTVAILIIYLVLGMLYESFIHPITILSALPFAAFGALITLLAFRTDLNIYAYVGIIMLVGLVKKNGIMMVDFALESQRTEGREPADAIVHACLIRFRPIMMTTMAALMGTLPIALGVGAGSESRRPLGLAVVGGLAVSQLITLYVTPVVYTYMDSFQRRLGEAAERRRLAASAGVLEAGAAD